GEEREHAEDAEDHGPQRQQQRVDRLNDRFDEGVPGDDEGSIHKRAVQGRGILGARGWNFNFDRRPRRPTAAGSMRGKENGYRERSRATRTDAGIRCASVVLWTSTEDLLVPWLRSQW